MSIYLGGNLIAGSGNGKADVDLSNLSVTGECHFLRLSTVHITETYINGANWYRVWSDGWIEQGGALIISNGDVYFNKVFSNTNYTLTYSGGGTQQSTGTRQLVTTRNVNMFHFINNATGNNTIMASWYACGY